MNEPQTDFIELISLVSGMGINVLKHEKLTTHAVTIIAGMLYREAINAGKLLGKETDPLDTIKQKILIRQGLGTMDTVVDSEFQEIVNDL